MPAHARQQNGGDGQRPGEHPLEATRSRHAQRCPHLRPRLPIFFQAGVGDGRCPMGQRPVELGRRSPHRFRGQ